MKLTFERKLTPLEIAEAFCELNDEKQAQVFIEAARIAQGWKETGSFRGASAWWQWSQVGGHLRTCECSTVEAREMVRAIAQAIGS